MWPAWTRRLALGLVGLVLASPLAEAGEKRDLRDAVRQDRQSLRVRQSDLKRSDINRAEDRLDAIERKAQSDPAAAQEMLRLHEADQRLLENMRPGPNDPEAKR